MCGRNIYIARALLRRKQQKVQLDSNFTRTIASSYVAPQKTADVIIHLKLKLKKLSTADSPKISPSSHGALQLFPHCDPSHPYPFIEE